jgi:LacI family transcriptional regulator
MLSAFPQVSQKRIAEEAGVSQATVSLVLAGRGVSSEETARRVMEAAERLKYRPNLLVHGIQTGKTRMVGVMAAPVDFYWSEVFYGIHDVLTDADHVPVMVWTAHSGPAPRRRTAQGVDQELKQIHRLLDRRVDGVILWPAFASLFQEHVHEFSSRGVPVVTIDYELPSQFRADSVGSDEPAGGRLVAEHLLSLGHRRLGHLAGTRGEAWADGRRKAFEHAVRECPGAHCVTLDANLKDVDQGLEQARTMLRLAERPTAIFAASDPLAKSVYHAAAEIGLRVPQDVSVVGFADDDFAPEMAPPLTTVRQSGYDTGRRAAELVLARSNGTSKAGKTHRVRLPVELIVRQSTAPTPVGAPSRAAAAAAV